MRRAYFGGLFPNTTYNGPQAARPTAPADVTARHADRYVTTNPSLRDPRTFNTDTPFQTNLDDVHIYTLELIWHTGFADVKYVGGYQGYTYTQESDFDGTVARDPYTVRSAAARPPSADLPATPFTIFPQVEAFYQEDKEYYSNEINLISTHDGPLQWILGLYQYHEQVYQSSGVARRMQPQLEHAAHGRDFGRRRSARRIRIAILQNAGAYARCGCARRVRADRLHLQRPLEDDDRCALHRGQQGRRGIPHARAVRLRDAHPPAAARAAGSRCLRVLQRDRSAQSLAGEWHATTGTAGLEWTPNDDTLAFVKYTRGYKSGGFNAGSFAPGRDGLHRSGVHQLRTSSA